MGIVRTTPLIVIIYFYLALIICQGDRYIINHNHHHYHHHYSHGHKKHKQNPSPPPPPPGSQISLPPSPPPECCNNNPPSTSPPPEDGNYYPEIFDVRVFGAIGDGLSDDTEAFKSAWDFACRQDSADYGIVLVPSGYSFMVQSTIFTGPCNTDIVFQVDGVVMPPDGPENWPINLSRRQWLVFYRTDNLLMQGRGLIDGKGESWWNLPCKPHKGINGRTIRGSCDSPVAIRFFMSNNVTIKGLRIKNSPKVHFRFDNCSNVYLDSVRISSPALSPNTDGIHIENTDNARIYNSVISTGDDCVSIGSGCYDVDIRNVTCGPGHGISIGSLGNRNTRACVSNVKVRDSVIKNSDNGVRIKTWQGGSGSVTGITFTNLHMYNVRNPIIIDQFYCITTTATTPPESSSLLSCFNQTSGVFVSDIVYESIKGTYDIRSPPIHFACSDTVPCTNITLSDIELLPAEGEIVLDPYCWNAYGGFQTLTIPPVYCLLDGLPGSLLEHQLGFC